MTAVTYRIRIAGPGDVEAIRNLVRAAYRDYVPRIGREPAPMAADYEQLVDAGVVRVVAQDAEDAPIVGVLVIMPMPDHLFLETIAVEPVLHGRGIGRLLMAHAEDEAYVMGLPEIRLYTNGRMTENLRWYPRLGYEETGRHHEDGFDRVYFRKQLPT
mgnify:FL=1